MDGCANWPQDACGMLLFRREALDLAPDPTCLHLTIAKVVLCAVRTPVVVFLRQRA